jgi:ketosteroid isomerase-like protein
MMKFMLLSLLLLLAGPLRADTESEIATALDYFSEVWNAGDLEAIRGYYHPDFVLINQDGATPLQQRLDDIKSVTSDGEDRGVMETSQVTVRELGEKYAVAYAYSVLTFKDGSAINKWFTTVYEKTPFGWKAILTQN